MLHMQFLWSYRKRLQNFKPLILPGLWYIASVYDRPILEIQVQIFVCGRPRLVLY